MFVIKNNALRYITPYDASIEAMSFEDWTDFSWSLSIEIYDLGIGPCVELFRLNQKIP